MAVAARRVDRLEKLAGEIAEEGGKAYPVKLDVTRADEIAKALDSIESAFGTVTVLVNNAGMNVRKPILDVTEVDYDVVMGTDLRAVFFVAQAVARRLAASGQGGRIINIASLAAQRPVRSLGVYCAAKAGVAQLTKAMAMEWRHCRSM